MSRARRKPSRPVPYVAIGAIAATVLVLALVGFTIKHESSSVPQAGQVVGFTPQPERPGSLWVGDSYTAGTGASSTAMAESCLTSNMLGWDCDLDAEGGTGFINNGQLNDPTFQPLIKRLPGDLTTYPTPSVIIIDAGRNDSGDPAPVEAAASTYFDTLTKDYPKVPVVLIEPYFMTSTSSAFQTIRTWMTTQAQQRGWKAIDPIGEGWINTTSATMVIADDVHPNPAGHQYIAQHLSADLKSLPISAVPAA